MNDDELLEHIESAALRCAVDAGVDPHGCLVGRSAELVFQIAKLLRKLPVRRAGDLRILRSRLGRLCELVGADEQRVLLELHRRLGESDAFEVVEAFERKAG